MLMDDRELRETIMKLKEILSPKALHKLYSHFGSLEIKIENLITSRDNWKRKYLELKGGKEK